MTGAKVWSARAGGIIEVLRARWWYVAVFTLLLFLPILVFGGVSVPGVFSFGFKSFARNLAIVMVIGVLLRADGLAWTGSSILVPLLGFLLAGGISVWVNQGNWGEVRLLETAIGLFVGARVMSSTRTGYLLLFHWLGAVVVVTIAAEIITNPSILTFTEDLRNSLVTSHPNTLGFFFALTSPVFVAAAMGRTHPIAWLYALCTLIGVGVTFSRSAWFAWLVGAILVSLGLGHRRRLRHRLLTAAVAASIVLVAIGVLSLGRSEADMQRLRILEASLSLFREHWLFGIGYGIWNLERVFPARYMELFGTELFLFHSHNLYVDVLAGAGIVGTAAMAVLLLNLGRIAIRGVMRTRSDARMPRETVGYAAQLGVFLLLGLVDMPLFHPKILFTLAFLWGTMEALSSGNVLDDAEARPLLRSSRLSLRPLDASDAESLYRHWNQPDVRRFLWDDLPVSRTTVDEVLRASRVDFSRHGYGLWGLRMGESSELVGIGGMRQVAGTDNVEVLYSLDPSLWGAGLATEAASAILAYGFEKVGLGRIVGGVDEPNLASQRVLTKLGMTPLGPIRLNGMSVPYFAITREIFLASPHHPCRFEV